MKKAFLFVLLLLLPALLYAYIGDEDGRDWWRWTEHEKACVITGFILANAAINKYGNETNSISGPFFDYPDAVGNMIDKITSYYNKDPKRLNHKLWRVIFWIYKKYNSEDWQPGE